MPWSSVSLDAFQRQPDGTYREMGMVAYEFHGDVFLNAKNQMIASDGMYGSWRLADYPGGIEKNLNDLIPPGVIYSPQVIGFADDGRILVESFQPKSAGPDWYHDYLLTPPGLPAPTPAPEPASVLAWGLATAAVGLFSAKKRLSR